MNVTRTPARMLLVAVCLVCMLGALTARRAAGQSVDLDSALLRLDDLPVGWSIIDGQDDTSDVGDEGDCEDGGPPIVPIATASILFERATETPGSLDQPSVGTGYAVLVHGVVSFAPGVGARAFACLRADVAESLTGSPPDPDVETSVTALTLDGLGDERFGVRLVERSRGESSGPFAAASSVTEYVLMRRGEIISLVAIFQVDLYGTSNAASSTESIVRLAGIADQRLAVALKGR